MKTYRVTIVQFKTLTVKAESELEALESDEVSDESLSTQGWEHDETTAKEIA